MPKTRQAKIGKKATFRATLANAGSGPATAVELCVRAPRRLARVKGKRCVTEEALDPDAEMDPRFKIVPTRKARGKKMDVTFTATADGLETEEATATLAVRARR